MYTDPRKTSKEVPRRTPAKDTPASGEEHWGQGAASALARMRHQERAKAEDRRALRDRQR
ncbi:hypothetical protein [Ramlibacter sp. AN1133]|uniref:hypothetical protein n=1 Tax=Ramlibacter sp. AN1133 TaxID=3133429 RepID=UPI0030C18A48